MSHYAGRVLEFRLGAGGSRSPRIGCPPKAVPAPGQYLLAHAPADPDVLFPAPLFLQEAAADGFLAAPLDLAETAGWDLGTGLALRGPLGQGFRLPGILRNLALVALGDSVARLAPLISAAADTALFTDLPVYGLPARVEVQPLSAIREAAGWADFLAADVPLEETGRLPELLHGLNVPGQALVTSPMPCGGLAECGVCTLKGGRRPVLLCSDGPVVELGKLV